MKKLLIISAMLFITLGMSAQNNRNRSARERKTTVTETQKATRPETRTRPTSTNSTSTRPAERRTSTSHSVTRTPERRPSDNHSVTRPAERRPSHSSSTQPARRPSATSDRNRSTNERYTQPPRRTSTPANRDVHRPSNNHGNVDRNRSNNNRVVNPGHTKDYNRHPGNVDRPSSVSHGTRVTYDPKRGRTYEERRKVYVTHDPRRVVRTVPHVNYTPRPLEYRREHYSYRMPPRMNIVWNERMYREYVILYPDFHLWYYPFGYAIHTISSYDAAGYIGEIARVYGRVYETWYSPESDEYFLYFGGPYPYHDFSVVLEGRDARRFSWRPERYFNNRYIAVTGLISLWQDKPEIDVRKRSQVEVY